MTVKDGDRIRITGVSVPHHQEGVELGSEHVVIKVLTVPSGAICVCTDDGLGLISSVGDRWTVLDGIDPGAAT